MASRDTYARSALAQIPRLLGNQDRNSLSPTYGCFHRDYWFEKTSDFPDAVRQFAVHALALVYRHEFPGNAYRGHPKIREWAIAGLDYWARIQHGDGSFDEFYPYERGWVGPTAFTTFTSAEAYRLLRDEPIAPEIARRIENAIGRAARFIAAGESEQDDLANHHAMACLAVWEAHRLLGDTELGAAHERLWRRFLDYFDADEGWSREYDGVDPGYLSATVSFLAKIHQDEPSPELARVLAASAEFCAYFVYPNGFYAGSIGSRNTLHFYPHGFEILAAESPIAAAVADKMLAALEEGKLVPPAIMSDRYVAYRVPELLQAYLDWRERPEPQALLPCERPPFSRWFPRSRIYVARREGRYLVANLAKGGVTKLFDTDCAGLLINDCGLIGRLADGRIVTSQWIDPAYECEAADGEWKVRGRLQEVPSHKLFTPAKNVLFRLALLALGWNPAFSHALKRWIRHLLILGQRAVPIRFERRLRLEDGAAMLEDELRVEGRVALETLSIGDEFFVRYVPQSRYFQAQELDCRALDLDQARVLAALRAGKGVRIRRRHETDGRVEVSVEEVE